MTMLEKAEEALEEVAVVGSDGWISNTAACVRAVLTAIREPDEGMLEAAIAPYQYDNTPEFNAAYKRTVAGYMSAMIDAILAEKP